MRGTKRGFCAIGLVLLMTAGCALPDFLNLVEWKEGAGKDAGVRVLGQLDVQGHP
jgi:hypothetical protein